MDIKELIVKIKESFPSNAIDISESLELLKETINETMENISKEMNNIFSTRDFDSIASFTELAKEINIYEKKLEELIDLLEVDEVEVIDEEIQEENETRALPDYSAYQVDTQVEHTLYENFTHKRPFTFRINDQHVIEVKTWKEMLVKTCELLIEIDEDKFIQFENNRTMNGKKRKLFSKVSKGMHTPKSISNKIYIETNINANGIRNLLLKLLREYGFKPSEFKIYLRADYTELHV